MGGQDMRRLLAAESPALLRAVEDGLLSLERGEDAAEAAQSVLRALHSVASGSSLAGLEPMARLAGGMELALRLVVYQRLAPEQPLTDALLQAADVLAAMFARVEELEHVDPDGALRALDAALGAGLSFSELEEIRPREMADSGWRLSPWLVEQKLAREGLFHLTLTPEAQVSGETLYTRLGELLTLGEVLACAPQEQGKMALLYASPLEEDLLREALSLPRELLRPLDAAQMGLAVSATPPLAHRPVQPLPEPSPPSPAPPQTAPAQPPAKAAQAETPAKEPAPLAGVQGEHLVFHLGAETYAVEVGLVREIITVPPVTRLPLTPPHVLGVVNLRGSLVPVFDLRRKLGLPEREKGPLVAILLRLGDKLQAAVVDAVQEVIPVSEDEVQETPDMSGQIKRAYLRGLYEHQGEMVILLDLARLLAGEAGGHEL